jgi:TatD DNase family protein
MKLLADLGYYFGVGGTSTYKNNTELREAIQLMPMERIVLETDCPFLSPAAVRRERNDSSKIAYVVDELAQLKDVTPEEIIVISNANVKKLYPKMFH